MDYKLLALDLDGTLLRRDGSIHPDDVRAIERARAAGVHVTIATGRLYSGSRSTAAACGIRAPIACVDGSHIVDANDHETLFYRGIAGAHAQSLRDVLARHEASTFVFAQDRIVHDSGGEPYAVYVRTWSPHTEIVDRAIDHHAWDHADGVAAVVTVGAPSAVEGAAEELRELLDGVAHVITFPVMRLEATHAMIIRAAGTTKGTAIEWLAKHHGIAPAEVVVVGDWINDLPMFRVAGRSFAMGQAPDAVKASATHHLDAHANEGGGVAEAIKKTWGNL